MPRTCSSRWQALVNASAFYRLFYPCGYTNIGHGDAVTDNFPSVARSTGWDIGADLGSAWAINLPIQAPMTVASGVASSSIVLSDTA